MLENQTCRSRGARRLAQGDITTVMTGPWAFLLGSPLKLAFWLGNRLVTWTGLLVVWRTLKNRPDRTRRFVRWVLLLNVASLLGLVSLWWAFFVRKG